MESVSVGCEPRTFTCAVEVPVTRQSAKIFAPLWARWNPMQYVVRLPVSTPPTGSAPQSIEVMVAMAATAGFGFSSGVR